MAQTVKVNLREWDNPVRLAFIRWLINEGFTVTYKDGTVNAIKLS